MLFTNNFKAGTPKLHKILTFPLQRLFKYYVNLRILLSFAYLSKYVNCCFISSYLFIINTLKVLISNTCLALFISYISFSNLILIIGELFHIFATKNLSKLFIITYSASNTYLKRCPKFYIIF